jgi:hypothetical protein
LLIAAITGSGDITENNASALLDDYLPEDVLVYVPSYMTSDGMRVVVQWLKSANINIERVKKPMMSSFLLGNPEADEKVLIVLGVSGSEEIILECMEENVPVLDLTRGLFQVTREEASETEMPLDGPESNGETTKPLPGTPMTPQDDLGLSGVSEPYRMKWEPRPDILEQLNHNKGILYKLWNNDELLYIGQTTKYPLLRMYAHASKGGLGSDRWKKITKIETAEVPIEFLDRAEFVLIHFFHPPLNAACKCDFRETVKDKTEEEIMRAAVVAGESNWEPSPAETGKVATKEEITYVTKYYQNGKGKIRKAGRSKIKPGEKEVWLTEEEVESRIN